ncbi:MAG TPA: response regulator [Methylomirabilota bacterium]|nr:response regulator [Methylomirabilota bacterium]
MNTVLIVDDEPDVRALARDILVAKEFDVLEAGDAEEALRVAARHAGPIPLLLTDVVMPGASGPELARRLQELRKETKVVFMSGFTAEVIGDFGVLESGVPFVCKPFSPEMLARKVREALDYRSPFARPTRRLVPSASPA